MASYYCPKCDENRSETPFCRKHGPMRCREEDRLQEALKEITRLKQRIQHLRDQQ